MGKILRVYTDGSCFPNPGKGAYAYIVIDNTGTIVKKYAMSFVLTTNNRMELRPFIAFLQWAQSEPVSLGRITSYEKVIVTSDSQYLVYGVQNRMAKWKSQGWHNTGGKVANIDLWKKIDRLLCNFSNLEIRHTKGHSGNTYNNMVDKLAVQERLNNDNPCEDLEYMNSLKTRQLSIGEEL